jgi:hypothetical protein
MVPVSIFFLFRHGNVDDRLDAAVYARVGSERFCGQWVVVGSLSARRVDEEAEADGQRFAAEEVAEESPVRIGASLGLWAASVICGFGEQGLVSGNEEDLQGWLS